MVLKEDGTRVVCPAIVHTYLASCMAGRVNLNYSYGKAHGFLHIWDVDGELTDSHGNGKVTPYYYLHGEETTREQYLKAVKSDPILRQLIGRPDRTLACTSLSRLARLLWRAQQ